MLMYACVDVEQAREDLRAPTSLDRSLMAWHSRQIHQQ